MNSPSTTFLLQLLCLLPAMFITLGKVSTPSAGMIVVITLAAVSTAMSLTLRFALLWNAQRELAGMLMNWMSGTRVMPSSDSPLPLIWTESTGELLLPEGSSEGEQR